MTCITARVIADSVNPDGDRLTTLECTYPRFIHSELMTHRVMSRNAASSRAIPISKIMRQVLHDPAIPVAWGKTQKGMQARTELTGWRRTSARRLFLWARFPAVAFAWLLMKVGLHKQVTNRILEPWMWMTTIFSATTWENFYKLRLHPDAQPEFHELARCMWVVTDASMPRRLEWGEWHLPYIDVDEELDGLPPADGRALVHSSIFTLPRVSAACCARVSYVRQGVRKKDDVAFADKLASDGHFSPLEHPAKATRGRWANYTGWRQLRSLYDGESGETNKVESFHCR